MEENLCAICLDVREWGTEIDTKMLATTSCNHTFHIGCLTKWIKQNNICPLCKHENPHTELRDISLGLQVWENKHQHNYFMERKTLTREERKEKLNNLPMFDRIKLTFNTNTGEFDD